jgi:hypothetical protein
LATEITGYILLAKTAEGSFIFNREIDHIVALDEGHDRPVWSWIKSGSKRVPKQTLVPSSVDQILNEGLLMLVDGAFGTESSTLANVSALLDGYIVNVVLFERSTLSTQLEALATLGINHKVLR